MSRLVVLLAIGGFLAGGCRAKDSGRRPSSAPASVEVVKLAPKRFTRTLSALGSLRSAETTVVTSEIAGRLVFLDIPEGQTVKRGHVLARLDAKRTAAELEVARARLEGAQETLARSQALSQEQLLSQQAVDEALTASRTASGTVQLSRAELEKTEIRAPFSGTVGIREVSLGAFISPGTPITRITNKHALEFVFTVPERQAEKLSVGQAVHGIVGSCSQQFEGRVNVVAPTVDPNTRSLQAVAQIADGDGRLLPGMSARARIEVEVVEKALLIPEEALVRSGTEQQVFVVDEQGKALVKNVRAGELRSGQVEITAGLRPGVTLIVTGQQRLKNGSAVNAKPYEPVVNPNLKLGGAKSESECWF